MKILQESFACYNLENQQHGGKPGAKTLPDGRWCAYPSEDLTGDKASLEEMFWLKDACNDRPG